MMQGTDPRRERGGILILTVLLMLFLAGLSGSLLTIQFHRDRLKVQYMNKINAVYSAEGGLNYAVELVWNGFLAAPGGKKLADLQLYLSKNAIAPKSWTNVPLTLLKSSPGVTTLVQVYRTDSTDYTDLRFRASSTVLSHTETVESTFRSDGQTFSGFNFALFSNNISCTFCHLKIDNVLKNPTTPYERVRVAALESLMVRTGSADTTIAGTLYTTGKIMNNSGTVLSDLAASSVDGYSFTNNMIDPKTTKLVDLYAAPNDSSGNPVAGYNLYKDYPKDPSKQTDGKMPTDFPSVYSDVNGNRTVDNAEFQTAAQTASGKVSGYGFVVPQGNTFGGSLSTTNPVAVNGAAEGNLILTGTAANPIRLDGKVVVNGDVIIQGVVQGTGSIVARGNVYVTGDLTYNDAVVNGVRNFGVAADGTQNGLGLAAGGNVLIGDYLTPKGGSLTSSTSIITGESSGGYGFALSQLSVFNRREWQKTQPLLPGPRGVPVPNSTYIPGYTPKFYVVNQTNPVWLFYKSSYWDDSKQTWMGPEHAGSFTGLTALTPPPGAVISTLDPSNPWVTPTQLKQFWMADEAKRTSGSALKIDGLVYTDGAVFTLARGASKTDGNLVVNGALVARDTGILAGGSLQLNYDQRVTSFLDIKDSTDVAFHRLLQVRRNPNIASN